MNLAFSFLAPLPAFIATHPKVALWKYKSERRKHRRGWLSEQVRTWAILRTAVFSGVSSLLLVPFLNGGATGRMIVTVMVVAFAAAAAGPCYDR